MKTNPVKAKLHSGQPTFGAWLSFGNLHAARILARSGFDWLALDMEHSPIDWSQAAAIFAVVADAGCVPLCRVPEGNHHFIKRALDAGAWGIVAPMINTIEQAKTVIAAAKYPPYGNRSVGDGMNALNFDASPGEYYERANDEILVILQVESPTGVDTAEGISHNPGCDALFVGPGDLSFNMRRLDGSRPTEADLEAMIQRVIAIGKRKNMPTGIHAMDPRDALQRAEQGMQFIAVSSDVAMMTAKAREYVEVIRQAARQSPMQDAVDDSCGRLLNR